MISRHSINVYPFFSGLEPEYIRILVEVANRVSVKPDYHFFRTGEELDSFYLVVDGEVGIYIEVTDQSVEQTLTMQLTRDLVTKDIIVSTVGPGEVFGWSALVPPHESTGGAKANKASQVIEFNCEDLRPIIKSDSHFAYLITLKAAQIIRKRLRDKCVEILSEIMA